MLKIDKIRNREAGRVALINARQLIDLSQTKLDEIKRSPARSDEFRQLRDLLNTILGKVVDDQDTEIAR